MLIVSICIGQLVSYIVVVKSTNTHRFQQEGCLSLELQYLCNFTPPKLTLINHVCVLHGTETNYSPLADESVGHIIILIRALFIC